MGARPYDPAIGRFTAIDPVPGGSLNNYDYAAQDPVNGYDLSGSILSAMDLGSCTIGSCGGNAPSFNPAGVAPIGTILQRLTTGTATPLTVTSIVLDVAALGCVVVTDGACTPLAVSAMASAFTAAAVNDKVGAAWR